MESGPSETVIGERYVIKVIINPKESIEGIAAEMAFLLALKHDNIIKMYEARESGKV